MKHLRTIVAVLTVALAAVSCGQRGQKSSSSAGEATAADSLSVEAGKPSLAKQLADLPPEPVFDIRTNYGTIRVMLYEGTPKHRKNFAKLALSGFYDGTLFHRVIDGFMIQGGDPLSKDEARADEWGTGGPGYTIPAEINSQYSHRKGALAAARRGDAANPRKESNGSQFYIVQNERSCSHLDGDYTIFGETIEGFEVIDRIAAVYTDYKDCPVDPVKIEKVVFIR